jgi:hypothetical protein
MKNEFAAKIWRGQFNFISVGEDACSTKLFWRNGGSFFDQQFPLPSPRDEEKNDNSKMGGDDAE